MEPKDYTVVRIEGEYAYLRADTDREGDELFIAMALLPEGVDEGTRLHYEMFSYTIIEQNQAIKLLTKMVCRDIVEESRTLFGCNKLKTL